MVLSQRLQLPNAFARRSLVRTTRLKRVTLPDLMLTTAPIAVEIRRYTEATRGGSRCMGAASRLRRLTCAGTRGQPRRHTAFLLYCDPGQS